MLFHSIAILIWRASPSLFLRLRLAYPFAPAIVASLLLAPIVMNVVLPPDPDPLTLGTRTVFDLLTLTRTALLFVLAGVLTAVNLVTLLITTGSYSLNVAVILLPVVIPLVLYRLPPRTAQHASVAHLEPVTASDVVTSENQWLYWDQAMMALTESVCVRTRCIGQT